MNTAREQTTAPVRVLRAPVDVGGSQAFFAESIPGNSVAAFGEIELAPPSDEGRPTALTLAFAITEPGAIFPWQYHSGGTEMALIVQGEGVIELDPGERRAKPDSFPFAAGDIVLIDAGVLYQVRNTSSTTPLRAWVSFPLGAASFWPDGRKA
jgi:mannose-6-phosphate isomerase-like protein (cupin superfamily)